MTIEKNSAFVGTPQGDVLLGRPVRENTWQGVIADNHGLYERRGGVCQLYAGQTYTTSSSSYTTATDSAQGSNLIESGGLLQLRRPIEEAADKVRVKLSARIAYLDLEVTIWRAAWASPGLPYLQLAQVVLSNTGAFARTSDLVTLDLTEVETLTQPLLLDIRLRAKANSSPTIASMTEAYAWEDRDLLTSELPTPGA